MASSISIGLDFGTHQTKICTENADDPRNPIYEFLEFDSPSGPVRFLPSVVQINKDKTVSYGFTDEKRAFSLQSRHKTLPPELISLPKPDFFIIPKEPVEAPDLPIPPEPIAGSKNYQQELQEWNATCKDIRLKNLEKHYNFQHAHADWKLDATPKIKRNKAEEFRYRLALALESERYQKAQTYWEDHDIEPVPAIFRYFKIASFSKKASWQHDLSPKIISAWYLTYVMFLIQEKYGMLYFTQMGIPKNEEDKELSQWQISNAHDIYYAAYKLFVFYGSKELFLKASYETLIEQTLFEGNDKDEIIENNLLVLSEAYAGLRSITENHQLEYGLNLLVDIGGGSTDVSLFYTDTKTNEPNISIIYSIHKGLNYIFECENENGEDINSVRERFENDTTQFNESILDFTSNIAQLIYSEIYQKLTQVAKEKNIPYDSIYACIKGRPIIYAGGGSIYSPLRKELQLFSDVRQITKDSLRIPNIANKDIKDEEFPILAIAYGLSIPRLDMPNMTPLSRMFDGIQINEQKSESYIHGFTDL